MSCRHSLIIRFRLFGICSLCLSSDFLRPKPLFPYVIHNVGKCFYLPLYIPLHCWLKNHADIMIEATPHCFTISFTSCYLFLDVSHCLLVLTIARRPSSFIKSPLLSWDDSDTERFLTMWVVSWAGSSCVSPVQSVRWVWIITLPHWLGVSSIIGCFLLYCLSSI